MPKRRKAQILTHYSGKRNQNLATNGLAQFSCVILKM
jgi:hypothetical protein